VTLLDAPVADALAAFAAAMAAAGCPQRCDVVERPLEGALGLVAATPVRALVALPAWPVAAMDGFAVRARETAAGAALAVGAHRPIDTGTPLPQGFDAVAMIEHVVQAADGSVTLAAAVAPGANVRGVGETFAAGGELVPAGRRLRPADVAVAIAGGHAALAVHARPIVMILPTGDEVRPAGEPLAPGGVSDSNGPMLAAQVALDGGLATVAAPTSDDVDALAAAIVDAAGRSDLVLVVAGSSRGRRDRTRAAVEHVGEVAVAGIAVRPCHPLILGVVRRTPVIGIPGYPLSAALAYELVVAPLLAALQGASPERRQLAATLTAAVAGRPDATCLVPVRLAALGTAIVATPLPRRGAALTALVGCDGVLRVPPLDGSLAAGAAVLVDVLPC